MAKKTQNTKHENRDRKRDRDGVQAKRRDARRAKAKRRAFETSGKHR